MKKTILILSILLGSISFAFPSLSGSSGLINMPTADSLRYKEYNLGFAYYNDATAGTVCKYFGNLGTFNGFELGFIGNTEKEGVFLNMKYYMLSDKSSTPLALAFGIDNISSFSLTNLYLVLSKKMKPELDFHLGFLTNVSRGKIAPQLMIGGEYLLTKNLLFITDMVGENSSWNVSAGFRFFLASNLILNAAVTDISNSSGAGSNTISVGLAYIDFM